MTNHLEQPPFPSLAEFNDAVRASDNTLAHRLATLMLEDHFDNTLRGAPEFWKPQPHEHNNYLLRQTCLQEDGAPAAAGSAVVISGRNAYVRKYRVHSYGADGASNITTAEWAKGDEQMTHVLNGDNSIMPLELVESTVKHAHPELTEIVPPTGAKAFLRYMFYRGTRILYVAQSARLPGATGSYPE